MQYFAIPAVTNEAGSAHDGTTVLPTKLAETFVSGRRVPRTPPAQSPQSRRPGIPGRGGQDPAGGRRPGFA